MNHRRSPDEALRALFDAVHTAAARGGGLADGLAAAAAGGALFRGKEALAALDPVLLAAQGPEVFRETLLTFAAAQLRQLALEHDLALAQELGDLAAPAMVDLLWSRAQRRRAAIRAG